MMTTIHYFAVTVSGIMVIQSFLWWQCWKKWRLQKAEAQRDIQRWQAKAEEADRNLNAIRDVPPLPTTTQFVRHLSEFCEGIRSHVQSLEEVRLRSVNPLQLVAEEAENARVISRKQRFLHYFQVLSQANVEISSRIGRLAESYAAATALRSSLEAGHMKLPAEDLECRAIDEVIQALKLEEPPDVTWRRKIESIKKEFEPIYEARVQRSGLERLERENSLAVAALSFQKFKLPPITPLEKFYRTVFSHGQRDSMG
jgi:hypothetical protein